MISLRDVTARRRAEARRLDFYSIIAHDLRSPLNSISLRTQLISGGKHGPLSEGLREDMQKIDQNIQSLVGMVNDFLDMAGSSTRPFAASRAAGCVRAARRHDGEHPAACSRAAVSAGSASFRPSSGLRDRR
jgi:signal transduction histidine kinase